MKKLLFVTFLVVSFVLQGVYKLPVELQSEYRSLFSREIKNKLKEGQEEYARNLFRKLWKDSGEDGNPTADFYAFARYEIAKFFARLEKYENALENINAAISWLLKGKKDSEYAIETSWNYETLKEEVVGKAEEYLAIKGAILSAIKKREKAIKIYKLLYKHGKERDKENYFRQMVYLAKSLKSCDLDFILEIYDKKISKLEKEISDIKNEISKIEAKPEPVESKKMAEKQRKFNLDFNKRIAESKLDILVAGQLKLLDLCGDAKSKSKAMKIKKDLGLYLEYPMEEKELPGEDF